MFVEAKLEKRLLMGAFGVPGAGKSYGVAAMACATIAVWGLKPIITVFDTENAWGKLEKVCADAFGVKVMQWEPTLPPNPEFPGRKGLTGASEARKFLAASEKHSAGMVIFDSITHILEAEEKQYLENGDRPKWLAGKAMEGNEYGRARKDFKGLTPLILGSPCSTAIIGRHSLEYGVVEGKNAPVGNKMKGAGIDYEVDLLLEFRRTETKRSKKDAEPHKVFSIGIEKDRYNTMRPHSTSEDSLQPGDEASVEHFKSIGRLIVPVLNKIAKPQVKAPAEPEEASE
mgnify:CR=1 FL=1